jgi:hypothetical protein
VAPAKMFQVPDFTVLKRFLETVRGTHHGTGRHGLRLTRSEEENRSGDVAPALAHHARHQSRRLKPSDTNCASVLILSKTGWKINTVFRESPLFSVG